MKFRVKYWLILCGANVMLALISASAHRLGFLLLAVALVMLCWNMANYLISKEDVNA